MNRAAVFEPTSGSGARLLGTQLLAVSHTASHTTSLSTIASNNALNILTFRDPIEALLVGRLCYQSGTIVVNCNPSGGDLSQL